MNTTGPGGGRSLAERLQAWPRLAGEVLRVLAWMPDPDHALIVTRVLEDAGLRVDAVTAADEAAERFRHGGYDGCVFPGGDEELAALRELRRQDARQPVVVLARGSRDGLHAALAAGATDALMLAPGYELALPALVAQSIHRLRTGSDDAPRLSSMAEHVAELEDQVTALREQLDARAAEVEVSRRAVQDAFTQRSTMLANVSHELRTPLTTILGFTGVLADRSSGPINAEQEQQLGLIRRAATQLLSLINDVLEMARLETGQTELACLPVDLGALVRDCREGLADQVRGRDILVDMRALPCRVESDPTRLRQALWNLCMQAARTTVRGRITLELEPRDGGGAVLRVTDTSPGMSAEDLGLLFEKFHHLPPSKRKASRMGGLTRGLGIPLAADLARALGGSLEATSEPGRGTVFTMVLPERSPTLAVRR